MAFAGTLSSYRRWSSRKVSALAIIIIVIMAGMVVGLRGKGRPGTVLDVSDANSLESSRYISLNNTVWRDPLNDSSQWEVSYPRQNMTTPELFANGALHLNATFVSEPQAQAVDIHRTVNFSLAEDPVLQISVAASVGVHYGIRMSGQDSLGNPFQAWSESSPLQHRPGLGRIANFTINAAVEAFRANGALPAPGSSITSLMFYIEATPGQAGKFALNVYGITVLASQEYGFNPTEKVLGRMAGLILTLNSTNSLGFSDNQFAEGYIDYALSGSPSLVYTVYYMHGLTVVGQGFQYSESALTFTIAAISASNVRNYPPILTTNDTFSIVLAPILGQFLSFQLRDFSIRYLSQAPLTATPPQINPSIILPYYLIFLFVMPVAIVTLVSRLYSHETR